MLRDYKCLMLETNDNRKFFTNEENYDSLIEFANNVSAGIHVVNLNIANDDSILNLNDLASAISENNNKTPVETPEYTILETKLQPKNKRTRRNLGDKNKEIDAYITELLVNGQSVSIKELNERFKDWDMYATFYSNSITRVRKEQAEKGKELVKIGHGKYELKK